MNIPINGSFYQIPETGQIGGEQKRRDTHGYHGNVPFVHSHQNVMTAHGYVPYQERNQIDSNDYTSRGNFAFQNNHNVLNLYAPYPIFHNPFAHTTLVQNHIYQSQTNQGGFYNPIQHASVSCAPGIEIPDWKIPSWPGAAQSFASPKSRGSDSKKNAKQDVGAPLHPKTGPLQNGSSKRQSNMPKKAIKYRCSSCKIITEKVILKKKGPQNWLCVQCYNRYCNFTGYQKYLFDNLVRNAPAT